MGTTVGQPRCSAPATNGTLDAVLPSNSSGGAVLAVRILVERPWRPPTARLKEDGTQRGWSTVSTCSITSATCRMKRPTPPMQRTVPWGTSTWAGQGNAAYEDAAQYLIGNLESFGLEVITQRFTYDSLMTGAQNPEAYNICGYRFGEVNPDKWMVFGAHFDIAPPVNGGMLDPHIFGRTYGTRVGAYDNTAGTAMVLTVAEAMANFNTRNTMVFCLWSGGEGGKRGSDFWTDYWVKEDNPDVEVTNYVNLDMAGVNWPGGGGAHLRRQSRRRRRWCDPQPAVDPGYPKDEWSLADARPHRTKSGSRHHEPTRYGWFGDVDWVRRHWRQKSKCRCSSVRIAPADTWKVDDGWPKGST